MLKKKSAFFRVFYLPAFLLLLFFSLYAMLGVLGISFNKIDLKYPEVRGITVENYVNLLSDLRFWHSIKVSFLWSIATTFGSLIIGLFLAFFVYRKFKPRVETAISILFIIPFLLSKVGVAQIWKLMYRPFGLLNYFLSFINIGPIKFLSGSNIAFFSVITVDIWQWSFLVAFLLISLLNGIPPAYMEEADVIGANWFQRHWNLTLPMIFPGVLSIFFLKFVESLRTFDLVYNMTQGGPGTVSETLDLYAYFKGITIGGKISSAAAMSIVMLILTLFILILLWKFLWKRNIDNGNN